MMEEFKYSSEAPEATQVPGPGWKQDPNLPKKIIRYLEKIAERPRKHPLHKPVFDFLERWYDNTRYPGHVLRAIRADGKHR